MAPKCNVSRTDRCLCHTLLFGLSPRGLPAFNFSVRSSKAGAIWYLQQNRKCRRSTSLAVPFSDPLRGVKDCPVTGTKLPWSLSLMAVAAGSGFHHDVEEALADAGGLAVAAINHPGDTANDSSQRTAGSGEILVPTATITLGYCGQLGRPPRKKARGSWPLSVQANATLPVI